MGKRDTDGESYNLSDLPGKIPGSVVDDDADIDSQPSSTSSSGKMPKKVQIGGAESFEDVDLVRNVLLMAVLLTTPLITHPKMAAT